MYISPYLVGAGFGALIVSFLWLAMIMAVARTAERKSKEDGQ